MLTHLDQLLMCNINDKVYLFSNNIPYIFPHTCLIFLRLLCTESRCSDGHSHILSGLSHDLFRLPMNTLNKQSNKGHNRKSKVCTCMTPFDVPCYSSTF